MAQILRYLKFYGFELGALINFAHSKVGIRRMIFEESPIDFEEKFERMMPYVNEEDKVILRQVLTHIKRIARQYGLGYHESLYRKLIAVELTHHGISCGYDIHVPATYEGEKLGTQATPFMLVENRFLLHVRALIDGTTAHDFLTMRTFLAELGLKVGWIINFGRNKVYIQATAVKT
ncbi:MAG: GxxExxY protein [Anaerolineales bacterium]|nr:GxxExxY protein [Anaerolineales bacterium]